MKFFFGVAYSTAPNQKTITNPKRNDIGVSSRLAMLYSSYRTLRNPKNLASSDAKARCLRAWESRRRASCHCPPALAA